MKQLLAVYALVGCLTFISVFNGDRCSSDVPVSQMRVCVNDEAASAAKSALAWPYFWSIYFDLRGLVQ